MTPRRINQYTALLLVVGLGAALALYLHAAHSRADSLLGDPLATKKYVRKLRMIGGKANVLAAEISDWFSGLWEGESLGRTIAVLTVIGTLAFRFAAQHRTQNRSPD